MKSTIDRRTAMQELELISGDILFECETSCDTKRLGKIAFEKHYYNRFDTILKELQRLEKFDEFDWLFIVKWLERENVDNKLLDEFKTKIELVLENDYKEQVWDKYIKEDLCVK